MTEANPDAAPRIADVVFDCGAHVGVFVHRALQRGAAKVVAIEPEDRNLECLRRNFSREISNGKVMVVSQGVWSSETTLRFAVSDNSSAAGSTVFDAGIHVTRIPVTTIDRIAQRLALPSISYIKMDIEGAEREALRGATTVLARHHPRLMIAGYHQPDDYTVLSHLLATANFGYRMTCSPCVAVSHGDTPFVAPNALYFE